MAYLIQEWESIDPDNNRYRYYSLSLAKDLWGKEILIRRFGRIGNRKRESFYRPKNHRDLLQKIREITRQRKEHGYQPKNI